MGLCLSNLTMAAAALLLTAGAPAAEPPAARLYEDAKGTAAAVFPDAGKTGSALHERMVAMERELEREGHATAKRIIVAVRAAAALQKERPEAAPNAADVTARSLGLVEKEYGDLSDPGSAFAKAFWEAVPEVRAQLPEFESTGAWPLAAGVLAEFKAEGKSNTQNGPDFHLYQCWLTASGRAEWPPRERPANAAAVKITQTGADTWQGSDGMTITRTGAAQYQVRK